MRHFYQTIGAATLCAAKLIAPPSFLLGTHYRSIFVNQHMQTKHDIPHTWLDPRWRGDSGADYTNTSHICRQPYLTRINGLQPSSIIGSMAQPSAAMSALYFFFIDAAPFTECLPITVAKDAKGVLYTGSDLPTVDRMPRWSLDRMPSRYERSWPRICAADDTCTGSVKRVASAVGAGSVVFSDIHKAITNFELDTDA